MDQRWHICWAGNPDNGIDAASEATGLDLVGLVDEEAGGIVAYVASEGAERIAAKLNRAEAVTRV